jgi:transcriptional regulator with XRE-family HTH domain
MDVGRRVGAKVRALRSAQGLSQEELADRAGLHRTYISQIERAVKNVTLVSVEKVAKALDVSLAELVS